MAFDDLTLKLCVPPKENERDEEYERRMDEIMHEMYLKDLIKEAQEFNEVVV